MRGADHQEKLVLIVDDDPSVRLLLSEALQPAGFRVIEAEDGEQALALLADFAPDLIMMDVMMPGMDGFAVCACIREMPERSETPIVMVTGNKDLASIQRAYDLGITDFITKPIQWGLIAYRVSFIMRANQGFADLKKSESRLVHAQRIAGIGSWEWELESDTIWFSEQALQIFHMDPRAYESSYLAFVASIHPADRDKVETAVTDAIEQTGFCSIDHQLFLADGKVSYVHTEAEVVRSGSGRPVRLEGTVQDITERKKVEAKVTEYANTQAMLLREVNHRVKNNLSVIISLLHKEQDRVLGEEMPGYAPLLDNLGLRIEGLLTVHSMLSSTGWQPLNLGELCRRVIGGLLEPLSLGNRLAVSETSILVDSGQAHYLALVINELATNSLKYAWVERSRLIISVTLVQHDGLIRLAYRDNGAGYPQRMIAGGPKAGEIGFDLLFGIVRTSLRGTIHLLNDGGAVAELEFPQASIMNNGGGASDRS